MVSLVCTLQDHLDDVNWCSFSAKLLATCSGDKTLRLYSCADFSELPFSPLTGHGYGVHCCCFSSCGQFLASCSTDATVVVWSTVSGEIEAVLEHPGRSPVRICALSPDCANLVSGASDGSLALWDFPSKRLQRTGAVEDTTMVACSFSPCSQMFMTGSTYGDLRLWDLDMNQLHAQKNAHDLGVTCCVFAPTILGDSNMVEFHLASSGQDSHVKIWTISKFISGGYKMQLLRKLTSQSAPVLSCAYSFDGQLLVSGSVDKTVAVYDAKNGILLYTLNQHDRYVTACAFSPSAPLIATGSMDKSVNIWKVEDGCSGHAGKCLPEESFVTSGQGSTSAGRSKLLVSDWSEEDVSVWLLDEGLEVLVDKFRSNNIDGTELLNLTKETLASELHIESVGLRGRVLRKVEELKNESLCTGIPDEFLCPITRELMKEPVIAADGYSYEREAIESWINTKNRSSPMTNLPLLTTLLTPNHTLKMAIGRWKTSR
ncbi:WD repeat, SAM and U-box domain-containing protein 1 isoform X1 [Synchiropus splendidus]|uniref:WD repeat, SAM and U-box domain-containing protein 1 isoform X1 n=1 Tax=Synchiropus splendidus TaxID=270530 RepID=UPI00237D71D9|nr:WD repeat, SAM and U-box domain-containing protein 1 isoform X1 [Synchiropus splendidus]XP_053722384.1 WD repeat, SAM and U-box domain-containing protein 1 isoform X1 [Synchiropus splendidus]XP_053722385.1 WD repeat, SAM and U-box domain-containing protein 1 isoform X1 [Synchiropus splendidus]XP_053722386.1 WD repeat, SAM and U-box domain-containing protein 1 isoform X1 [Synchiropus splendidus]